MSLLKAITIGLATLLAIPAATATGGFDTCTAVSFDTFKTTSVQEKLPQFGPKGLYSSSTTGECIYVDAAADGDFATNFPADYQGFLANTHILLSKVPEAAADLEYLSAAPLQELPAVTPRSAKMMARQTVGCGAVCNSSSVRNGRTYGQRSFLMSCTRALIGFATADRASTTLRSAFKEGIATYTTGASRYYSNDGYEGREFCRTEDVRCRHFLVSC
jgi:hypothetical protein